MIVLLPDPEESHTKDRVFAAVFLAVLLQHGRSLLLKRMPLASSLPF